MDWRSKARSAPPPHAAIQLVMVRGRHYYSYITDCSQSKQSWDEVSDPPSAFSWDTKEKKLRRHQGGTFGLNSDLLCKLPRQILLISFFPSFSLSLSFFHNLTDKCPLCAYADPAGLSFLANNARKSLPTQGTPLPLLYNG